MFLPRQTLNKIMAKANEAVEKKELVQIQPVILQNMVREIKRARHKIMIMGTRTGELRKELKKYETVERDNQQPEGDAGEE